MDYINRYLDHLSQSASKNTVYNYKLDLRTFFEFANIDLDETTVISTEAFVEHAKAQGKKASTINRVIASLKSFVKYINEYENLPIALQAEQADRTFRTMDAATKEVDFEELQKVLYAQTELKERLIVELLYAYGMRVSEIIAMKREDIDWAGARIVIGERTKPLFQGLILLLERYMDLYRISSGYLFPHKSDAARHMTREAATRIVKRVAVKAGIGAETVSSESFRYASAFSVIAKACDLTDLEQELECTEMGG